jgi:hypothetical protein
MSVFFFLGGGGLKIVSMNFILYLFDICMTGVKTVKATFLLPCDFLEMEDTRELSEREVKI